MAAQPADAETAGLVDLIDQLEKLLNDSELSEIEVEAGSTAFVLRKPNAFAAIATVMGSAPEAGAAGATVDGSPTAGSPASQSGQASESEPVNAIVAPLTGLYYSSPSPGAQAYVAIGSTVTVGQVIGLIEAMKLFNEIKSDRAGRVAKIYVEDGALVKAKQPLIEIQA